MDILRAIVPRTGGGAVVRGDWACLAISMNRPGSCLDECLESLLIEMMVVSKHLADSGCVHRVHGATISQAVLFICSCGVPIQSLQKRIARLGDHCNIGAG